MNVAVIGGSGFIGGVLATLLRDAGIEFRIVDVMPPKQASGSTFVEADIRDLPSLTNAIRGCDVVINLAAVHRDDVRPVSLYDEVNVAGSENVCRAAAALGIDRIIFTSSVAVYGFQEGIPDETTPPKPFNDYGRTKLLGEKVYEAWQREDASKRMLTIVRPTVVFGPGNRGNVYNLIRQLAGGAFVLVGDGSNRKSMAYVENVAAFLMYLLKSLPPAGQVFYNYVDKPDFRMLDLLELIRTSLGKSPRPLARLPYSVGLAIGNMFDIAARLTNLTFPISRVRIEKFCANTVFSSQRAQEIGFVAPFSLKQALKRTIAHEFSKQ